MSHWAMRRCSTISQGECGALAGRWPRSSGGRFLTPSSKEAWASAPVSRARRSFSGNFRFELWASFGFLSEWRLQFGWMMGEGVRVTGMSVLVVSEKEKDLTQRTQRSEHRGRGEE